MRYGSPLGDADTFDGRRVVVVGGGNSAGQAALHLAGHAASVSMVIRGDSPDRDMSRYLVERIERHDRITVSTSSEVVSGEGRDRLEGLTIPDPDRTEASRPTSCSS